MQTDNDSLPQLALVYMYKAKQDGFIYLEGEKRLFTFGTGYGEAQINGARHIVEEIEELTGTEIEELNLGQDS